MAKHIHREFITVENGREIGRCSCGCVKVYGKATEAWRYEKVTMRKDGLDGISRLLEG